jgi:hypothetical protein
VRAFYLAFYTTYFLLGALPAYAYLDPGTGSLLLYALVGMATTVLFAIRNIWYSLKGKAFLVSAAAVSSELPDVIFHSEGGKYWQVFKPVIEALAKEGVSCAYVTPDPSDPGLTFGPPTLKKIRPGGELASIAWMNAASAAMVVSTTPHLDVYTLRRSKRVKRYVHLFHAPTDIVFYEKYAFDWYDCLLTVGPFQESSVRELEKKRGTPAKELLPTGCTYFDYMRDEISALPPLRGDPPMVLYAPAWGVRSSALRYGTGIMESLVNRGMRVIFRPHPQFYVSHVELIHEIERWIASTGLVEIDRNRTGVAAMARSDTMITDLSGILFDYACLFERPVLLASPDVDAGGQEGEDLSGTLWDVASSKELAFALVDSDLTGLPELISNARQGAAGYAEKVRGFRDRSFYNFGKAGPVAAHNILSALRSVP